MINEQAIGANCKSCGAALPSNGQTCDYCRTGAVRALKKTAVGVVTPNHNPPKNIRAVLWGFWIAFAVLGWQFWPSDVLPRPIEVARAAKYLWFEEGLLPQLVTSYTVQFEALVIATLVSLLLAYAGSIPLFRPVVEFVSTLRFVSLGPLVIFFSLLITSEGHALKIYLLVFAIAVFYVTSMLPVVLEVPTEELEHARTLRMSEMHVTWEVVVLGRLDTALDMMRQNAAMGWMMITMIEGLVRSEGGIGALLQNQLKHFRLAEVAVIIIILFAVGFLQDCALRWLRTFLFPYADLERSRR